MIIFLYGQDSFRIKQQSKKMIEKFKNDRDPQGLNVVSLDSEKQQPGRIYEEIFTTPFLAEKKMIVIQNLLISKHKNLLIDLNDRIKEHKLAEENVILFIEYADSFKNKEAKALFDTLKKEKFAQELGNLNNAKIQAWIEEEVKNRKGKISKPSVNYLALHIGHNMWQLSNLLEQLIAYCFTREIGLEDVKLFVNEKQDDNIFNLVDAIINRQSKRVYGLIQEQYKKGEDVQFIFAMLLRQFRIILEIKDCLDKGDGLTSDIISKKLELHPFVVKKTLPMLKQYSTKGLKGIYNQLLNLDLQLKTSQGTPETLLDIFVGKICMAAN